MIFRALGTFEKWFVKSVKKEANRKDTLYHWYKKRKEAQKESKENGWMTK